MTGLAIAVVAIVEIGALAGLLLLIKRWQERRRRRIRPSDIQPVEPGTPRIRRERVTQIDAEPGSYRGPGRKGEPFMAPGGWLVLLTIFGGSAIYWLLGQAITPTVSHWVDWLLGY